MPRATSGASRSKPEDLPSSQRANGVSEVGWELGTISATGFSATPHDAAEQDHILKGLPTFTIRTGLNQRAACSGVGPPCSIQMLPTVSVSVAYR